MFITESRTYTQGIDPDSSLTKGVQFSFRRRLQFRNLYVLLLLMVIQEIYHSLEQRIIAIRLR